LASPDHGPFILAEAEVALEQSDGRAPVPGIETETRKPVLLSSRRPPREQRTLALTVPYANPFALQLAPACAGSVIPKRAKVLNPKAAIINFDWSLSLIVINQNLNCAYVIQIALRLKASQSHELHN
jgi:hypothetical protein